MFLDFNQQGTGFKHDASGTPVGPYGHGVGGLFSMPGQDAQVFSAMLKPQDSIIDDLPVIYPDQLGDWGGFQQEFDTIITGVTAGNQTIAAQPTEACTDFPTAGLMKVCTIVNQYARLGAKLRELDIEKVGMLANRADPTYLRIVNNPAAGDNSRMFPDVPGGYNDILYNEFTRRAFEAAFGFYIWLRQRIWTGTPSNSSASNGWKDLLGFQTQINTGTHIDAVSSAVCSAADSVVMPFGFQQIGAGPQNFMRNFDSMMYQLQWNADRMGLSPVRWKVYMRPELFDEIVKIWPIQYYNEYIAQVASMTNVRFNFGDETVRMRDEMRNGKYLFWRGQKVEVGLDLGIPEFTVTTASQLSAGQYASDIFVIPLTVLGGIPVTYLTPFRMDNPMTERIINAGRVLHTWTSDGGVFRWYTKQTNNCVSWEFVTMPRLSVRTPQIAGRMTNVAYSPLVHVRSDTPNDPYWVDGGRTTTASASYYAPWSVSTPVQVS